MREHARSYLQTEFREELALEKKWKRNVECRLAMALAMLLLFLAYLLRVRGREVKSQERTKKEKGVMGDDWES